MTSTGPPWEAAISRPSGLHVGNELRAEGDGLPAGPTGNHCTFTPAAHCPLMLSPAVHACSEAIHGDGCGQPAVYPREANLSLPRESRKNRQTRGGTALSRLLAARAMPDGSLGSSPGTTWAYPYSRAWSRCSHRRCRTLSWFRMAGVSSSHAAK